MFEREDLEIKMNPYLGNSENLIEYFCIVGYNQNTILSLIHEYKNDPKKNMIEPTILSSVISKLDYKTLDNNTIINQLYPKNPLIIPLEKNENGEFTELENRITNVIFSLCFDSLDGSTKLFYSCFAYKFYELYNYNNNEECYLIPKALCIFSQYSYFTTFYEICKNIHDIMSKNSSSQFLPIELIIYSIVNFLPSPIKYNINQQQFLTLKI